MFKEITQALPAVVAAHVAAYNRQDPEALMATFAADALVNDEHREFLGHAAIRGWADKSIFAANVTLAVQQAYEQHGDFILRCRVDGSFDKTNLPDPLILSYYFSVRDGRITQLIILLNSSNA